MHSRQTESNSMTDMTTTAADPAGSAEARRRQLYAGRILFVQWVRRSHGWFGLWGAVLGLTFGFSGIWLNHRAVLKLPPVAQQRSSSQILLPEPAPATVEAMRDWLQAALAIKGSPGTTRVEAARPVPWAENAERGKRSGAGKGKREGKREGGREGEDPSARSGDVAPSTEPVDSAAPRQSPPLMQPEHWTFNFGGPDVLIQADYWSGNKSVSIRTTSNGFMATLMNFHKGTGMTTAWILLADTLAGSLIFLSITGVILWVQTNRRRAIGAAIFFTSLTAVLGLALASMWG